jgi:hypothetical protein
LRHISYSSRGAFAKRFLPKDSIVAPVPVIQLHIQQVYSEQAGFQLLYNYAFGHPTSNILLLPSRSTGRNRRNANIRQAEITISIYKRLNCDCSRNFFFIYETQQQNTRKRRLRMDRIDITLSAFTSQQSGG